MINLKIKSYNVCVIKFSSIVETFSCKAILNVIKSSLSVKSLSSIKILIEKIDKFIDIYSIYPEHKEMITELENIKQLLSDDCYINCLLNVNE